VRLAGADATGHALAARLVAEEAQDVRAGGEQVRALGDDHRSARAEHRADFLQRVERERRVELVRSEEVRGGAAGLERLQLGAVLDAAGLVEQLAHGRAHRHQVDARMLDVARDAEVLEARLAVLALRLPPLSPTLDDHRHERQRLDRVHQRRLAVQAVYAGEGRLVARLAAVTLHALEQRRLLAEDVAAGGDEHVELEPAPRPLHVVAEQPGGAQGRELLAQDRLLGPVLVADEDPALLAAADEHPEQQALEHEVRLLGEHLAILEGPGLRLVGVADGVLGRRLLGRDELPLLAGRKARAAHAAQLRLLERGDYLLVLELARESPPQDAVVLVGRAVGVVVPALAGARRGRLGQRARAGVGDEAVGLLDVRGVV